MWKVTSGREKKETAQVAALKTVVCWLATSCLQRADRASYGLADLFQQASSVT